MLERSARLCVCGRVLCADLGGSSDNSDENSDAGEDEGSCVFFVDEVSREPKFVVEDLRKVSAFLFAGLCFYVGDE